MISHWTKPKPEGLGNVYSAALGHAFGSRWATTPSTLPSLVILRRLIPSATMRRWEAKWHVLSPPCGVGKGIQGLRVYAAMLAKANLDLPPEEKVGTLIVVREIETADELADQINATCVKLIGGRSSNREGAHIEVQPPIFSRPSSRPTFQG